MIKVEQELVHVTCSILKSNIFTVYDYNEPWSTRENPGKILLDIKNPNEDISKNSIFPEFDWTQLMCLTKTQFVGLHYIPCRVAKVERISGIICFYTGFGKGKIEVPCFWEDKVLETWSKATSKHSVTDEVNETISKAVK